MYADQHPQDLGCLSYLVTNSCANCFCQNPVKLLTVALQRCEGWSGCCVRQLHAHCSVQKLQASSNMLPGALLQGPPPQSCSPPTLGCLLVSCQVLIFFFTSQPSRGFKSGCQEQVGIVLLPAPTAERWSLGFTCSLPTGPAS